MEQPTTVSTVSIANLDLNELVEKSTLCINAVNSIESRAAALCDIFDSTEAWSEQAKALIIEGRDIAANIKTGRSVYTNAFDRVKTFFTGLEKRLTTEGEFARLTNLRNRYIKDLEAENLRLRMEAEKAKKAELERIESERQSKIAALEESVKVGALGQEAANEHINTIEMNSYVGVIEAEAAACVDIAPIGEVRMKTVVTLTDPRGAAAVFALWLKSCGVSMPLDKMLNVKISSMLLQIAKLDERVDSPFVVYTNEMRPVVRR